MAVTLAEAEDLARSHYRDQQSIVRRLLALIVRFGGRLDGDALARSWGVIDEELLAALIAAQEEAAAGGAAYVGEFGGAMAGEVVAAALAGTASDGRDLRTLMSIPLARAVQRRGDGASADEAVAQMIRHLLMLAGTQVADAGRAGAGVAMVADRAVIGYERVVRLPACSRCIVLAGRLYSWSAGFQRHPNCDCVHKPVTSIEEWRRARPENFPTRIFDRMSADERVRVFGRSGARAIRDGADIAQVVNARRGMQTAGGRVFTTEGTTARGLAGRGLGRLARVEGSRYRRSTIARIMPEAIYEAAGEDRDEAIRLLKRFGYIT
ncbi:hypothetical protein OHR68_09925 [Spirillospora sp. NBC_00431]